MSHYFDEESKEWKLLKSVPNVGEIVKKWSSVKYVGNCLYLASSDADKSDIYRYHMVNKSWEKLTKSSFPKIFQCLCCVGDYVYAVSESIPPEIYSLADKIWQQGRDNLHLFAQKGLKSVAAAAMNSKLYVMHGLLIFHQFRYVPKPALVHCFDPTKDKWEKVASTCYPHFGSSLIVVNNRLLLAWERESKRTTRQLVCCRTETHTRQQSRCSGNRRESIFYHQQISSRQWDKNSARGHAPG